MSLLLAASLVVLQTPASALQIAVTRSGRRIEAIEAAAGDLSVRTPWGLLSTPLDPVEQIVDARPQLAQLEKLHSNGFLDDESLLRDLSTAGQLTALGERLTALQQANSNSLLPYTLLDDWAAAIDPVPAELRFEKRVGWLWKRARAENFVDAVIAGRRLLEEVTTGTTVVSRHRSITETELATEGFSAARPWTRRTAALVAGKQHSPLLRQHLLEHSLNDVSPAVREACALECERTMAHAARQYWVMNMLRSDGTPRESAALHLGRFGGPEGRRALLYALSAWDQDAPERYEYHGRKIWLRKEYLREIGLIADKRHHYHPGQSAIAAWGNNYLFAPDAEHERIDLGTRLKISDYDAGFTSVLLDALDLSEGRKTGRTPVTWLTTLDDSYQPLEP